VPTYSPCRVAFGCGMSQTNRRVGFWLIGCFGSVSTTVAVGIAAIARGLMPTTGLSTTLPPLASLELDSLDHIVVGGHEIRKGDFYSAAHEIHKKSQIFSIPLLESIKADLDSWSGNIRPGLLVNAGVTIEQFSDQSVRPNNSLRAGILAIQKDIQDFQTRHHLDQVIMINIASTEAIFKDRPEYHSLETLNAAIDQDKRELLPSSSIYAYASIEAGYAFINFTPSLGASIPALQQLAIQRNVPIAGNDGKTGETLLKAALAPMFLARNLQVLSWVGHNILGAGDGQVLADPANKSSKIQTKDAILPAILGYKPQTHVSIEYIESMEGWKTAWDHIHFAGFLETKMTMQFTWQGCDSILAAPLVIDLARLVLHAHRRGESGVLDYLACYFKSPQGVTEHDFFKQVAKLHSYISQVER
jgi:myo-inositol-1-phosphate synthase